MCIRDRAISQPRFERFRRNLAWWCSLTFLTVPTVKNLKFQKSKMAAAAMLKNRKIAISRPRFNRFWHNLETVKNLKFCKSKMAAAAILKNRKIAISRPQFDRFWRNLARWRSSALVTGPLQRSKEIQDAGGRHPNNLKITISRQRFEQPSDFSVFT